MTCDWGFVSDKPVADRAFLSFDGFVQKKALMCYVRVNVGLMNVCAEKA
jgi:hypothetical protein